MGFPLSWQMPILFGDGRLSGTCHSTRTPRGGREEYRRPAWGTLSDDPDRTSLVPRVVKRLPTICAPLCLLGRSSQRVPHEGETTSIGQTVGRGHLGFREAPKEAVVSAGPSLTAQQRAALVGHGRLSGPVGLLTTSKATRRATSPSGILVSHPECRRAELFHNGEGMLGDRVGSDPPPTLFGRGGVHCPHGPPCPSLGYESGRSPGEIGQMAVTSVRVLLQGRVLPRC